VTSGVVGPILFAHETARTQLEEHGEVVTFRAGDRTTGRTWWRAERTGPKRGDVVVTELCAIEPTADRATLEQHVELSGFESVDAWLAAMDAVGDAGMPEHGHLYRVSEVDGGD
jgi:hypothetical protein